MVRMLPRHLLWVSGSSVICISSALVRITVRGVFSSWEASLTNCRCWLQAFSAGRTIHRARSSAMAKKASRHTRPMPAKAVARVFRVVFSLLMSAKTRVLEA